MKCTTLDIELAILREFDFRRNLMVSNVTDISGIVMFETDMIILSNNGYATGFEIKVSKADLKADLKKRQFVNLAKQYNGKTGFERYFYPFKYFNYIVPIGMEQAVVDQVPDFCGIYIVDNSKRFNKISCIRKAKKLFDYKWSEVRRYKLARLGAMRLYSLKLKIWKGQR